MVHINNYDIRFENYFQSGNNFSVSLFYKEFKNHIELEYSNSYYWQNVDKSNVAGVEVDGKIGLLKQLELRTNITFVNSTTTFVRTRNETIGGVTNIIYEDTIKRPMFGQAPYVVNGSLSYTPDSLGLTLTLSYNLQGPRLVIASNNASIPDVYELDRHLVDFKITKKLGKHFVAAITARNILNSPVRRSYKADDGYKLYDKYTYGTNYIVGLTYKL
jgi:outer membrane receptor protein involved in Fe transport